MSGVLSWLYYIILADRIVGFLDVSLKEIGNFNFKTHFV